MPIIIAIIGIIIIVSLIKAHLLLSIGAIAVMIFIAIMKHISNKKMRKEHGISEKAIKIKYYGQYSKKLNNKIYYWKENSNMFFNDPKANVNIKVNKNDIISFNTIGNYSESQRISGGKVSGGGVSLGGAIAGGAIAGPVGAIIGGRKKVKSQPIRTETVVTDTRKVVLNFMDNGSNKEQMVLDYCIYKQLCDICPKKNEDTHKTSKNIEDDISTKIKKLAELKDQGILTEEEFTKKKTELLSKM